MTMTYVTVGTTAVYIPIIVGTQAGTQEGLARGWGKPHGCTEKVHSYHETGGSGRTQAYFGNNVLVLAYRGWPVKGGGGSDIGLARSSSCIRSVVMLARTYL